MPVKKSTKQSNHPGPGKSEALCLPETSEAAIVTQTSTEIIASEKQQPGKGKRKRGNPKEPAEVIKEETPKKAKRSAKIKVEEIGVDADHPTQVSPTKTKRSTKVKVEEKGSLSKSEPSADANQAPIKAKRKTIVKQETKDLDGEEISKDIEEEGATPKKTKRKRKTKEEKEAEAMPIAARTAGLRMFVGAHVSGAKGWSQRSISNHWMYIASVAEALYRSRRAQFDHKLPPHRVTPPILLPRAS